MIRSIRSQRPCAFTRPRPSTCAALFWLAAVPLGFVGCGSGKDTAPRDVAGDVLTGTARHALLVAEAAASSWMRDAHLIYLENDAPLAAGGTIQSGTSVDQVVAQKIGHQTKLPSLVLGCEKANPSVHKNYSMLYSSHISWSSPTTPTPLEVYPALAFDQLFADKTGRGDQSVLDAVDKTLIPSAQNAELKDLLVKTRPAFVDHLQHARKLQSSLGKGDAAAHDAADSH